ncbi:hypothetical protein F4801DRAFT_255512 [Xylaria longipes]|nr:hypothetical protein F4801DRAFT_255512 [Xylaria longipes]RYC63590.1 hypothetical protein CHU98_g2620 [Xylaria longipes]
MTTPEQNLPTTGEERGEASNTSRDSATQQASELGQANDANEAPALPQRPYTHPQVLPQPFFNQQQHVYTPYTNQQVAYANPVRPLPKQSSAYIATRLGLTVLSSVWGIIIIALTSILLSDGGTSASVSLYSYAIVVASIIWNTAELITYCVRLRKETQRGIHPGAHVGLHLIFWLVGIFAILLSASVYLSVAYDVHNCEHSDDDDSYSYSYYGYSYCSQYQPLSYYKWNVLPVLRALLAIFALWVINHFVLFVLACIETHKRNVLRPTAFVIPANTVPTQGMYYPQQPGVQPMQPLQFYPYPVMMPLPQPAHLAGAESRTPVSNEKQPAQAHQNQNVAGFYAPSSGVLSGAP